MQILTTDVFDEWLANLRDTKVRARITDRIKRAGDGNFGKCEPIGSGLSELKLDFGPGYRVYFFVEGRTVVVLLCGGDKRSQPNDIKLAHKLAKDWKNR
ncbi:type II toxin-antitoxin system RelE/ParE family toxin [Hyphomicrobium sp. MC8b]|uniref:type II toxin-antitoxin system RelE/ParE family toxin n=1 Tax=Hyphomicrobium sp. MC8b TaxID=300273 RepID=UPI00391A43F7